MRLPKKPHTRTTYIDSILNKLENLVGKMLTKTQFKLIEKKMERLRVANEKLRESGIYWHDACKDTVRDLMGKKKSR
jgi:hypothetical protein